MDKSVNNFYDNFMSSRMLHYRINGNLRIDFAKEFLKTHIASNKHILEIGCGIGILSEHLVKNCKAQRLLSLDLSEKNIWYASNSVFDERITFKQLDILQQDAKKYLQEHVDVYGKFDYVVLIDVIEHIPHETYPVFFNHIKNYLQNEFKLLMTYPSPEYQQYLRNENPSELQPVDEIVNLKTLELFEDLIHGDLEYFASKDVWLRGQYNHAIISNRKGLQTVKNPDEAILHRIFSRLFGKITKRYLYHRYAVKPFKKK